MNKKYYTAQEVQLKKQIAILAKKELEFEDKLNKLLPNKKIKVFNYKSPNVREKLGFCCKI